MNIDFNNQKKELLKDTSILQNITNEQPNLHISNLMNL